MNLPGVLIPVPIPVAHYDRPPQDEELLLFTSTPATEWNEDLVAVDLVDVRTAYRKAIDLFDWWGRKVGGE